MERTRKRKRETPSETESKIETKSKRKSACTRACEHVRESTFARQHAHESTPKREHVHTRACARARETMHAWEREHAHNTWEHARASAREKWVHAYGYTKTCSCWLASVSSKRWRVWVSIICAHGSCALLNSWICVDVCVCERESQTHIHMEREFECLPSVHMPRVPFHSWTRKREKFIYRENEIHVQFKGVFGCLSSVHTPRVPYSTAGYVWKCVWERDNHVYTLRECCESLSSVHRADVPFHGWTRERDEYIYREGKIYVQIERVFGCLSSAHTAPVPLHGWTKERGTYRCRENIYIYRLREWNTHADWKSAWVSIICAHASCAWLNNSYSQ